MKDVSLHSCQEIPVAPSDRVRLKTVNGQWSFVTLPTRIPCEFGVGAEGKKNLRRFRRRIKKALGL